MAHTSLCVGLWTSLVLAPALARAAEDPCVGPLQKIVALSRSEAKKYLANEEAHANALSFLARIGGYRHTAAQSEIRREAMLFDLLPLMKDPGPALTQWKPFMQEFERNVLEHKLNAELLAKIDALVSVLVKGDAEPTALQLEVIGHVMERYGLKKGRERELSSLGDAVKKKDRQGIVRALDVLRKDMRAENQAIENYVGRNYTRYSYIRKQVDQAVSGENTRVIRNGVRRSIEAANSVNFESMPMGMAATLDSEIDDTVNWMHEFSLGQKKPADFQAFAKRYDLDSKNTANLLRQWSSADPKLPLPDAVHSGVLDEVRKVESELKGGARYVKVLTEFDRQIEPLPQSQEKIAKILPKGARRPALEDAAQIYAGDRARSAKRKRDEEIEWGRFAATFVAQASRERIKGLSELSIAGKKVHDPFLLKVIRDAHEYAVRMSHEEPIYLLKGLKNEDPKALVEMVENFASGPNGDEFLQTFARHADTKGIWRAVQEEAAKHKDVDPKPLYGRMQNAKKVVDDLKLDQISSLSEQDFGKRSMLKLLAAGVGVGVTVWGGTQLVTGWLQAQPETPIPVEVEKKAMDALARVKNTVENMRKGTATEKDLEHATNGLKDALKLVPLK